MDKNNHNTLASDIVSKCDKLFASEERANKESVWSELAEFILPGQFGSFGGATAKGTKKSQRVFSSAPIQDNHDLASTIHSTLTNPATRWARARFVDEEVSEDNDSKEWLDDAMNKFHDALAISNFNNEIVKVYKTFTALGSSAFMHEERPITKQGEFGGFVFKAWHLSEVAWSEDIEGMVDTIYRKFKLTAKQIQQKWGMKIPSIVKEAIEKGDLEKEFKFIHSISPRPDNEIKVNEEGLAKPEHRPVASVYVFVTGPYLMDVGGYYEFPTHVPRWETREGEVYGTSPGHIAIYDIRTLNKIIASGLKILAKLADPPTLAEQRAIITELDLRPGGFSVVKDINGIRELVTDAKFDVTQFAVNDLLKSINRVFFLDKLFLPDRRETGEMTAFEIVTRTEQLQQVIGPTLGRLNVELLDPIVKRGFQMMLRGGAFKELPPLLQQRGLNIEVEYVNILARAQKVEEVTSILKWVQYVAALAQVNQTAVDIVNTDEAARIIGKRLGVPLPVIADPKDVAQLREQRAKQQQQEEALEAGVKVADIMSKTGGGEGNVQ